jgi:glycosyltransferase involved in cell wall biosynthesis
VCNDWLELSMVAACGFPGKVIHVVHGDYDYYYDLAERFAPYVDAFVAVSRQIYKELARRVPSRVDSIHQIPCGVQPAPPVLPRPSKAPLRVLYVGRLHEGKGVFDLPLIDAAIRRNHLSVSWTLVGDGPAAAELRRRWSEDHVRFLGALNHDAVLQEYSKHDVFILPTRAEGFPLTLLEAMSAGLVPVVSDLPSGIPEVVQDSTGFRVLPGEIDGFAEKISRLARSPEVLKALGAEARNKIHRGFTIEQVADRYNELFHRCYMSKARPAAAPLLSGNYLDRIWIPNPLVLGLRSFNALRPSLLKRRWQAFRKRREQLQLSVQDGYAYRVNTQQHA